VELVLLFTTTFMFSCAAFAVDRELAAMTATDVDDHVGSSPSAHANDEVLHMFALLDAGWFVTSFAAGPFRTMDEYAVAIAARDFKHTLTQDMFVDRHVDTLVANALFQNSPTPGQLRAVGDVLAVFKSYTRIARIAFQPINFAGSDSDAARFEQISDRIDLVGPHWCLNLNFYRSARNVVVRNGTAAGGYNVDQIITLLGRAIDRRELEQMFDDDLFEVLFPVVAPQTAVRGTYTEYRNQPLLAHEICWMVHDPTIVDRVKRVVVEVCRFFGLTRAPDKQLVSFEVDEDDGELKKAWNDMVASEDRFFEKLGQILDFCTALGRKRHCFAIVEGLLRINGFGAKFRAALRVRVLPRFTGDEFERLSAMMPKRLAGDYTTYGDSDDDTDYAARL
jgi:hypothetical protein